MKLNKEQVARYNELSDKHLGNTKDGQKLFDAHPPADTFTGLVIGRLYEAHDHKRMFRKTVYYILQWDTGTYDYRARNEAMRGAMDFIQGYHAFASESDRDEFLELINLRRK